MLHRRDAMIRLGTAGLGALALPNLLRAERAVAAASAAPQATAKSCILIYLWGGPPQQDMWDLKPDAPEGIRSQFQPIDTVVPGIRICDQMPQIARHTDKLAIIRSYTHPSNAHEVGVYHTLTGKIDNTLAVPRNQRKRSDFPNPSAVVSHFSPPGSMPASVTIPKPIGHDGVIYTGTYAGFLGAQHDPLELQSPGEVNVRAPHSLDMPDGMDATRLQARHGLLKLMESHDRVVQKRGITPGGAPGLEQFREQAFRMLMSPESRGAFDVSQEPDAVRDRYGRNEYGESFLLSRRLVAAGVRLVSVVWSYICPDGNVANVWDNHGGTGSLGGITGFAMLKEKYCLPPLDQAYSALLEDLSARGMLDETLVVMLGEFGRTPKINSAQGRDHWGPCQSVVLAGGGIRGGQLYGSSDQHAAYPKTHAVSPEDLIATMYHAMGIGPESLIYDHERRPHRLTEGRPLVELFG
ncbi:MAG: DUF1501 domain-containing protein [Pirellulales bacterium]